MTWDSTEDVVESCIQQFVGNVSSVRYFGEPWLQDLPNWFGGKAKKERFLDLMTALGYAVLYEEMACNWWWLEAANKARVAILDRLEVRQNLRWFRHCVRELNRRATDNGELRNSLDTFLELVGTPFCETFSYQHGKLPNKEIKTISRFTNHIQNSLWTSFNNEMMHYWKAPSPQMILDRKALGSDIDADIPPCSGS